MVSCSCCGREGVNIRTCGTKGHKCPSGIHGRQDESPAARASAPSKGGAKAAQKATKATGHVTPALGMQPPGMPVVVRTAPVMQLSSPLTLACAIGGRTAAAASAAAPRPSPLGTGAAPEEERSLRMNVSGKKPDVWEHRHQQDLYTLQSSSVVERYDPEVDHVWEVQLLDVAWKRASMQLPPAHSTRQAAHTTIGHVVNSVANLNVTTAEVNGKKKGPFTRWKNDDRVQDGKTVPIDEVMRSNGPVTRGWERTWSNITRSVVLTHDEMARAVSDSTTRNVEPFMDELHTMMEQMDIG